MATLFFSFQNVLPSQKLAAATEQISKLSADLNDRESHLRFYEEQLDLASKQAKEIEDRYDEMELKLGSVRILLFADDIGRNSGYGINRD